MIKSQMFILNYRLRFKKKKSQKGFDLYSADFL